MSEILGASEKENCGPCAGGATEPGAPAKEPVRKLDADNYLGGFLVDDQLMAGVGKEEAKEGTEPGFFAYVLRHETAEYLGYQTFKNLDEALASINQIPRDWIYENLSGCGGGKCGEGKCKGEKCSLFNRQPTNPSTPF